MGAPGLASETWVYTPRSGRSTNHFFYPEVHVRTDPMTKIRRRSFLKSIGAAAAASALPPYLHALSQAPLSATYTAPPILLNQLGYLPNHAKLATVLLAKFPNHRLLHPIPYPLHPVLPRSAQ